ncbi:hypothetical protein Tco_0487308 [Tanacetum coccineum]
MVTDAPTEGQTGVNMPRMKLDSEFTPEETNRENADTQAEIILSQGRTLQQRKEDLFDEFERFRAIGNEPIHDYFVRFHKLVNDMKITQLEIPTHQPETPNLSPTFPAYWVKNIANLLSGFQKQFPPTNNQLMSSSNSRTHATLQEECDMFLTAEGRHVARQCKEPKRQRFSVLQRSKMLSWKQRKRELLLMLKLKIPRQCGCTTPISTSGNGSNKTVFESTKRIAYDQDVDKALMLEASLHGQSIIHHNPRYGKKAPVINASNAWDTDETLASAEVSMAKMKGKPGHEVAEFKEIHYALEDEYERCVLENKNLIIEKKNLLIKNDSLITECLERDICSIVLYSDVAVTPSSNCSCDNLRLKCDREHNKVLELEAEISKQKRLITESEKRFAFLEQNYVSLQLKFQNYKQCSDTSSASNAIFEINKLRDQLQGKDATIRNLDAQINIMKVLNVGSAEGSVDKQALDTECIQLKDTITSLRIQLDGLKAENVNLKRRYEELSKSNAYSRSTFTAKINALTAENAKLKTELTGRPTRKVVGSVKHQWKPIGRYFTLYDNCPLTRIMEPIVEPLELTPSVSSSSKVTMISRFTDCKLSDRKAGSKGISGIFEC